jgi:hypothetical protein
MFGGPLQFFDGTNGNSISGAPSYGLTATPSFSSSGKYFAYSVRKSTDPSQYNKQTHEQFSGPCDIALSDYDEKTHTASNPKTIVAAQGSDCLVFPSLSPDDALIVFQRGLFSNNRWVSTMQS